MSTHVDSFTAIGILARTSNARERTDSATIPVMWARLHKEDFLSRIPDRVDNRILAVYYDYENGKDAEYSYLLGAKVSHPAAAPAGMSAKEIEAGEYAVFAGKGAPPPELVPNLWKRIWSLEDHGQLKRAYRTDFEVYSPDGSVDIYIGITR